MNNVQKLTARQRAHFLGVVEAASRSLRQAEIAREAGISPSQVSRILRTQEAVEMVEGLRAKAMAESWTNFQGLLDLAIQNLNHCLKSPLVHSSTKAQVSMKLLQIALDGAAAGDERDTAPITIILGGQPEKAAYPDPDSQSSDYGIHGEGHLGSRIENDFNHKEPEVLL
jgi:AraC-like DNA-binding protein